MLIVFRHFERHEHYVDLLPILTLRDCIATMAEPVGYTSRTFRVVRKSTATGRIAAGSWHLISYLGKAFPVLVSGNVDGHSYSPLL